MKARCAIIWVAGVGGSPLALRDHRASVIKLQGGILSKTGGEVSAGVFPRGFWEGVAPEFFFWGGGVFEGKLKETNHCKATTTWSKHANAGFRFGGNKDRIRCAMYCLVTQATASTAKILGSWHVVRQSDVSRMEGPMKTRLSLSQNRNTWWFPFGFLLTPSKQGTLKKGQPYIVRGFCEMSCCVRSRFQPAEISVG